jgi:hypothetical protein
MEFDKRRENAALYKLFDLERHVMHRNYFGMDVAAPPH